MKKNKKYWKNEAKHWKEIARIESEQANDWAKRAFKVEEELESANEVIGEYYDQIEELEDQVLYFKYANMSRTSANWWKNIGINLPSNKCDGNCDCNCKN